jgi:hypothetical protein
MRENAQPKLNGADWTTLALDDAENQEKHEQSAWDYTEGG